jgi:hypothetical protein
LIALLLATAAAVQTSQPDPLAPLPQGQAPVTAPAQPVVSEPQPAVVQPQPVVAQPLPTVVQPPVRAPIVVPKDWRGVFAAIRSGDWAAAQAGSYALPPDVLTPLAKAELYTAKGSPPVDLGRLQALLAEAPELPDADQLARLAITRGATTPPAIYQERPVVGLGSGPRRYRAKPVAGEPYADALRAQLDEYVKANDATNAEAAFLSQAPWLSANARTEAAQRVAWIYYSLGRDFDARRVVDYWRTGSSGEWGSQAAWVSGLASWRLGDCNAASRAFREVASSATQRELSAGGYYWAARSNNMRRR